MISPAKSLTRKIDEFLFSIFSWFCRIALVILAVHFFAFVVAFFYLVIVEAIQWSRGFWVWFFEVFSGGQS